MCHHGAVTDDHVELHTELHGAAAASLAAAEAALRATGERVTQLRSAVLAVLAERADHLSADQIAGALETGDRPVHRATVYRTLERLAEVGVAASMTVAGGPTLYHLAATPGGHPHLHARCRECGAVSVLPRTALDETQRVAASAGFRLDAMHSTLVGECDACAGIVEQSTAGGRSHHHAE